MVRLILPLIGGGGDGDPRRVNLPTWTLIEILPDGVRAVVDVPASELPPGLQLPTGVRNGGTGLASDPGRLSAQARQMWAEYLDRRYEEYAGRFRPGSE